MRSNIHQSSIKGIEMAGACAVREYGREFALSALCEDSALCYLGFYAFDFTKVELGK